MSNEAVNKRYILWTGGVDSTFMLLQFARKELELQPVYVIDPERKSIQYEIQAMERIINLLETRYASDVKARILPLKIYELKDIPQDAYLTECFRKVAGKVKIGTQYEWLSRLAALYPFLDIGVEKTIGAFSGCLTAIMNDGGFVDTDEIGRLNTEKSSEETVAVFGKYRFPLYNLTETEMMSLVHSWGWDEIIRETWFCHHPIDGKPCGLCRPCQQKMDDNQQNLLPVAARRRYKIFSLLKRIMGEQMTGKVAAAYRRIRK